MLTSIYIWQSSRGVSKGQWATEASRWGHAPGLKAKSTMDGRDAGRLPVLWHRRQGQSDLQPQFLAPTTRHGQDPSFPSQTCSRWSSQQPLRHPAARDPPAYWLLVPDRHLCSIMAPCRREQLVLHNSPTQHVWGWQRYTQLVTVEWHAWSYQQPLLRKAS